MTTTVSVTTSIAIPTNISSATEVPTGLPAASPAFIVPPGGLPAQPPNTTLVQIGFLSPLNYPFVLANQVAQRQIFRFLPEGIAFSLSLDKAQISMQSLRADDTTGTLGYVTTLACFYMPTSNVSSFQSQLVIPNTILHHNPESSVSNLMSMINPTIPITAEVPLGARQSSAVTPTMTPKNSSARLSSGSRISIGVMVPVAIIAIFLLGFLFWRRRKASRHNADRSKPRIEENDADSKIHEMAANTRRFEF